MTPIGVEAYSGTGRIADDGVVFLVAHEAPSLDDVHLALRHILARAFDVVQLTILANPVSRTPRHFCYFFSAAKQIDEVVKRIGRQLEQ